MAMPCLALHALPSYSARHTLVELDSNPNAYSSRPTQILVPQQHLFLPADIRLDYPSFTALSASAFPLFSRLNCRGATIIKS